MSMYGSYEYVIKDRDVSELEKAVEDAKTFEELKQAVKKLIWYLNYRGIQVPD